MNKCRIVLLNGVGSAGKSSIARALQSIASEPYLHVQMDAFLEMLPDRYQDHPDTFSYEPVIENGYDAIAITTGPLGQRLMRGMRHAIVAMAEQGNNLIIDDVLLGAEKIEYPILLSPFEVHMVGVFAPLDVLEARERERGDRMIGLARWQYERVHAGMTYDLEVDAGSATPLECAKPIAEKFRL